MFQSQVIPRCRVQPTSTPEISHIITVLRKENCKFAVLGGGTSPFLEASNVRDGVTVDLGRMNKVEFVQGDTPTLNVGGGAIWADVYRELDPRNLSAVGTRNSLTGVVGSILGGKSRYLVHTQSGS